MNDDPTQPAARKVEVVYQIPWYGYESLDDTFEPILHLPRNNIISYHKRKKISLPADLNEAQLGYRDQHRADALSFVEITTTEQWRKICADQSNCIGT